MTNATIYTIAFKFLKKREKEFCMKKLLVGAIAFCVSIVSSMAQGVQSQNIALSNDVPQLHFGSIALGGRFQRFSSALQENGYTTLSAQGKFTHFMGYVANQPTKSIIVKGKYPNDIVSMVFVTLQPTIELEKAKTLFRAARQFVEKDKGLPAPVCERANLTPGQEVKRLHDAFQRMDVLYQCSYRLMDHTQTKPVGNVAVTLNSEDRVHFVVTVTYIDYWALLGNRLVFGRKTD